MKVKDIDALREQISKDPREAFTKHQVWLFASEHNKTVPTIEAIPKDQYENRLKADMVAMLEEIDKEFDNQYHINRHELHDDSLNVGLEQGQKIIQHKIDVLKENTDDR